MNIREIIQRACDDDMRDWHAEYTEVFAGPLHGFVADTDDCDTATYIATFDPEHVALMEAVCEAAAPFSPDAEVPFPDPPSDATDSRAALAYLEAVLSAIHPLLAVLSDEVGSLNAYRTERGL